MCYFVVTTILVLAVQHASTQELGEIFNVTVEQELPEAFKYIVDTRNHTLQTIKVTVTSPAATVEYPVFVSVNQLRGVTSWQIPFIDQSTLYYEVGHILCPTLNNPLNKSADDFNVTVTISTFSTTPVEVFIEAIAIERKEFILELDKPITVGVTSSSPVYYAFHFTPGVERVLIRVRSSHDTEDICAVASMQIASCPSDGVNSELFSKDGAFQSMRSLAAITTDRPDSQNFFYLIVAVFESSSDCRVSDSRGGLKDTSLTDNSNFLSSQINYAVRPHGPVKNVTIVIEEALTNSEYAVPVIVSLLFLVVIFYGGAFIGVIFIDYVLHGGHWINYPTNEDMTDQPDRDDLERGSRQSFRGSKRRPSLLKVLTGTYLNDIMKDVLSQNSTVPQFYTASLRSDRTPLGTQHPRSPRLLTRKASDTEPPQSPAYDCEITQSLPPSFHFSTGKKELTTSSGTSSNITTTVYKIAPTVSPASSSLKMTSKVSPSEVTMENEHLVESYSKQPSTETVKEQIHKMAAEQLNQMQESSESCAEGNMFEMQPHSSPESYTTTTTTTTTTTAAAAAATAAASPSDQPLTESVRVQDHKEAPKELHIIPECKEENLVEMELIPSVKSQTATIDPTSPSIASSQIGMISPPQLSPVPLSVAEQAVQVNIRPTTQKRAAKDWMVVTLADVNVCEGEEEQVRYRRYCWHLFTIAIFYALPAFQLILTYQQLLNTTGNQDICYYNYLCSHKLGEVSAFNNIWSNVGYVALGILFILLAARRQIKYRAIEEYNLKLNDPSCKTGVPQHFGIYYAIGVALVAEGFLSAFYHVCPNDTNFQFDTAFMFMIGGLGIYQIFHSRHPEFTCNAHILYLSFAVLIIIAFCGALYPSAAFWIVMFILHLLWTVFVSFQFYYNGVIKLGNGTVVIELLRTNYRKFPSWPNNLVKFIYVMVLFILNLILSIYGIVTYFTSMINFNSFVLTVIIANFTLYLLYYVSVKCKHQENNCHRQHPPPTLFIYLSIAVLCWIPAILYFRAAESDWTVSPARSRDRNDDCQLMGFFNSHDIWHFLSAIALFFSLLMLMSLDDNREHVHRRDILVF